MSRQAIRFLRCPPMVSKSPPAYRFAPLTDKAYTLLFALGFQSVARPVAVSRQAILFLACPPTVSKEPPAYTFVPFADRARTFQLAFGSHILSTVLSERYARYCYARALQPARRLRRYTIRRFRPAQPRRQRHLLLGMRVPRSISAVQKNAMPGIGPHIGKTATDINLVSILYNGTYPAICYPRPLARGIGRLGKNRGQTKQTYQQNRFCVTHSTKPPVKGSILY